jgi:hypothetical protein
MNKYETRSRLRTIVATSPFHSKSSLRGSKRVIACLQQLLVAYRFAMYNSAAPEPREMCHGNLDLNA